MSLTRSHRSISRRNRAKRINQAFELQLTSMMDVLVIIVVFLLKSYMASTNSFTTVAGLKLPLSASQDVPADSLHVIITPEAITFENERIVEFLQSGAGSLGNSGASYSFKAQDLDEGNRRILPLYDALIKARDKSELLRAKSKARDVGGKPLPFEGVLAIQADKRIQYDTLRKIMYTAGAAGFRVFRLLAMRRDS